MKIMIDSKRVPELRRKLMEKLLEMFEPDTTFEYREIEHMRNNGTVDTIEKRIVMHNKKKEISVKKSEFLDKSDIAKIFRLEPGCESQKFVTLRLC